MSHQTDLVREAFSHLHVAVGLNLEYQQGISLGKDVNFILAAFQADDAVGVWNTGYCGNWKNLSVFPQKRALTCHKD